MPGVLVNPGSRSVEAVSAADSPCLSERPLWLIIGNQRVIFAAARRAGSIRCVDAFAVCELRQTRVGGRRVLAYGLIMTTTAAYDAHADWYEDYVTGAAAEYTTRRQALLRRLLGAGHGVCLDLCCGNGV